MKCNAIRKPIDRCLNEEQHPMVVPKEVVENYTNRNCEDDCSEPSEK